MWFPFQMSAILTVIHESIVIAVMLRVIMQRPGTGVALAWIAIVAALPFGGVTLYLLFGERRIGLRRGKRVKSLRNHYDQLGHDTIRKRLTKVDWTAHSQAVQGMNTLAKKATGFPSVSGCSYNFFSDAESILKSIARDIDQAQESILMEFYIWNAGGVADDVLQALIRAAHRGVKCRILIDDLGARPWWKSQQPEQLRKAGIEVQPALPVGFFRALTGRNDLRLHRKIVLIDAKVAWTGSMNLVDPKYFKQDSGFGEWVDAMVRIHGSAVAPLGATVMGDWSVETGDSIDLLINDSHLAEVETDGDVDMQVFPSGPGETADGLLLLLLALFGSAEKEIVLTTPYFIPDDSLTRAIKGAAGRGVSVTLILPHKVDSLMTRYASRSYYDELLEAGVHLFLFKGGLLHTKSIAVDGKVSMFGTVNLDMRSLWLNYEVSLFVYNKTFTSDLMKLQRAYISESNELEAANWAKRSYLQKIIENFFRLASPLL